jgi:hypothetical protein
MLAVRLNEGRLYTPPGSLDMQRFTLRRQDAGERAAMRGLRINR